MAEYLAPLAPDDLPDFDYTRICFDDIEFVLRQMERPEQQANFEVTILPVDTPEQRLAAANEWAAYVQAKGQVEARKRGAVLMYSTRDESPEAYLRIIEDKENRDRPIPYAPFVTAAVLRVKRLRDAGLYELFREKYEKSE
jgi:hypothetical protein